MTQRAMEATAACARRGATSAPMLADELDAGQHDRPSTRSGS